MFDIIRRVQFLAGQRPMRSFFLLGQSPPLPYGSRRLCSKKLWSGLQLWVEIGVSGAVPACSEERGVAYDIVVIRFNSDTRSIIHNARNTAGI